MTDTTSARTDVPTGEVGAWIQALRAAEVGLFDAYVDARAWNGSLAVEGLPLDEYARVVCGLPATDLARLRRCADAARRLPGSTESFRRGELTLAQLDEVARLTRHLSELDRSRVDLTVADAASSGVGDPDRPLRLGSRLARQLLAATEVAPTEDAQLDDVWLVAQPSLLGGGRLESRLDDEGFATVVGAIEAAAGPPRPSSPRRQQLAEGLVALASRGAWTDPGATTCADPGATGGTGRRQPRVVVHVDLADATASVAGTLAWPIAGEAPTLTAATVDAIACDAELVVQLTDGVQPLARLRHRTAVPTVVREAVLDRDRGCRFPGCDAPAGWVDVHHVRFRSRGGDHAVENLVSLCRRHHRIVHRQRWELTLDPITGELTCRRGPTMLTSRPRARAPDPPPDTERPLSLWDVLGDLTPLPTWA